MMEPMQAVTQPAPVWSRPWLYGIAANLIARHRRAEMRHYRAVARAAPEAVDGHADRVAGRPRAGPRRAPRTRAPAAPPRGAPDRRRRHGRRDRRDGRDRRARGAAARPGDLRSSSTTRSSARKAGNATGEIKRGHEVVVERLRTAIVDRPGQRR
jgi:hypothetical protein